MDQEFISQTALDQMVSNDQAQMLKAAIPYLPPRGQQVISIYTKVQELSNALALFSPAGQTEQMQAASLPVTDPWRCCRISVNSAMGAAVKSWTEWSICLQWPKCSE